MIYFNILDSMPKNGIDRYLIKEYEDDEGRYWTCLSVSYHNGSEIGERSRVLVGDTFEEVKMTCDIFGIKIHHVERLDDWKMDKAENV